MGFKDVLVHVDASDAGKGRMSLAADLAARHHARLNALYIREPSIAQQRQLKASELGLASSYQTSSIRSAISDDLHGQATGLRRTLETLKNSAKIDVIWHDVTGHARMVVAQHARYADVTIVGHDAQEHSDLPEEYAFSEQILFSSGRPVLMLSPVACESVTRLGSRVAIAWNGSAAGARTLSAAMPMVESADNVTVLIVDAGRPASPEWIPPTKILDHLKRHAVNVEVREIEPQGRTISDALQQAAIDEDADVLIAGAHGRPNFWEKLLGGVTQGLLNEPRIPLLMCG